MDLEERLRQLEEDLYLARTTVLDLLPERARSVLESYHSAETPTERARWRHVTADKVAELAVPLEPSIYSTTPRAYCPLCGGGSSGPYEVGYAIPDGLKRHLTGWGNTFTCTVFVIAVELAYGYWGRTRREVRDDYWDYRNSLLDERRAVELQFRTGPGKPPELIDESLFGEARSTAQLDVTRQRLETLGFLVSEEERVIQYVREYGDLVVYADPRPERKIVLRAYWSSPKRDASDALGEFLLLDTWKNNLEVKIGAWVEAVREKA